MKANYDTIMEAVFKSEGGYVDNPKDPGGATNMGITRKTLARWRKVVPWSKLPKAAVKLLTKDEAAQIYDAYYWDEVQGDLLPSGIDYAVFDYAVNSGPQKAVMELQELVGVARDGRVGNITLAAVANYPGGMNELIVSYLDERLKFLRSLSTYPVFGKGWERRVKDVAALAMKLADKVENKGDDNKASDKEDGKSDGPTETNKWLNVLVVLGGLALSLIRVFGRK